MTSKNIISILKEMDELVKQAKVLQVKANNFRIKVAKFKDGVDVEVVRRKISGIK